MPNEVSGHSSAQYDISDPVTGGPGESGQPATEAGATPATPPAADSSASPPAINAREPGDKKHSSKDRVQVLLDNSSAGIISLVGERGVAVSTHLQLQTGSVDQKQDLDCFDIQELQSNGHSYRSLQAVLKEHTEALLSERILLLSCYSAEIARNAAKAMAFDLSEVKKDWVTVDKKTQSNLNFRELLDWLGKRNHKPHDGARPGSRVCVWDATNVSQGDLTDAILDSLLMDRAPIHSFRTRLGTYNLLLICVVSPQRIQGYKANKSAAATDLREWEIDFLPPLLEAHGHESLFDKITLQRRDGKWSRSDGDFYKEVLDRLRNGTLAEIVANGGREPAQNDSLKLNELFDRGDPIVDAVLYCAAFFPNLSPQDFFSLVELYLGDATEDIVKPAAHDPARPGEPTVIVESVPLCRRWQRESDAILTRCKLKAAVNDDNNRRVVDFQISGLRQRLSQHIRDEHYFFYESSFKLLRQRGILFTPRWEIANGARQLLVERAFQYAPQEVANWLYEIIVEFDEMADAVDLRTQQSSPFQFVPDTSVKAARRYVCYGLTLVLNRLNREPPLQEAVGLFWQALLRTRHQWFLDLLRRMGSVSPPETLAWLKQLLAQGTELIRHQVGNYLLLYLLRQDSNIFAALSELMLWPANSQPGQAARELFITYCVTINSQVSQTDYGKWPSSHPLFGFESVDQANERLDLLIGWLFDAAYASDADNATHEIADILAGWYFVLSPSPADETTQPEGDEIDAGRVRNLLLATTARRCSRALKNRLIDRWAEMKNEILNEVIDVENLSHLLTGPSLNAELMSNVAIVRRKLMDARRLLSTLRQDFISSAAQIAN